MLFFLCCGCNTKRASSRAYAQAPEEEIHTLKIRYGRDTYVHRRRDTYIEEEVHVSGASRRDTYIEEEIHI